ncbi:MAG: hypothetical protein H7Y86_06865 [Rhizobacter sp.]|nr:hypothetical protein [Ferruginibacter sp.]
MKKLFFLSAAAIVLTATVNAQVTQASLKSEIQIDKKVESNIKKEKKEARKELRKLKGKEVSYQAKQAFAIDFAGVTSISTERLDNFDEFTFSKDGQTMSAFYDFDSKLVGTTTKKSFSDLPAKAQKYIGEKYAGYTPVDVLMYDDNEFNETDMVLFGYQFDDEDSYFVELEKDNKKIVVQVGMDGGVSYFTRLT